MQEREKKVKIIATIGPASRSPRMIRTLIESGVNVFRLNFSHGDHETHGGSIAMIRKASRALGLEVAVLADLQGPKIRTRSTENDSAVTLATGSTVRITAKKVPCSDSVLSIDYKKIASEITVGQKVMVNDGAISLTVTAKEKNGDLVARVVSGGEYSSHKGVNFPDVDLSIPSLTAKDRRDLEFILSADVEFIALSFVRKAADVRALRRIVDRKRPDIRIIAKIEKPEATRRIGEILPLTDGIMVARGDLGVETTPFEVAILQKTLVEKTARAGKMVIVATQMLESMIKNPLPTRAESTDVANAVIDGTDAIMLSGETAVGLYPAQAVQTMTKIALVTEESGYCRRDVVDLSLGGEEGYPPHAVCEAAAWAGRDLGGIPIVVFTLSGATALYLAKLRYGFPVYAFSPDIKVVRTLSLAWNVSALHLPFAGDIGRLHRDAEKLLVKKRLLCLGDTYAIISGSSAIPGATNTLRIKRCGEA